ncbi:hypothetical protein V6N13_146314 [Hibiscus sabdariffa]
MEHSADVGICQHICAAAVFVVEPTIVAPQRGHEIAFFYVTSTGYLRTKITKTAATANLSEALGNLKSVIIGMGFMFSSWKPACGSSSYCSCHENRNLKITQAMAAEVHKNYNVL